MVTIIDKRGSRLTVPNGAYREIFKPQGWVLEGESNNTQTEQKALPQEEKEKVLDTSENSKMEYQNEQEGASVENGEDTFEQDEEDEEDLSEIPLSEMSITQLTAYAKQLGLDVKNINGVKALREAIKKAKK